MSSIVILVMVFVGVPAIVVCLVVRDIRYNRRLLRLWINRSIPVEDALRVVEMEEFAITHVSHSTRMPTGYYIVRADSLETYGLYNAVIEQGMRINAPEQTIRILVEERGLKGRVWDVYGDPLDVP